MTTDHYREVIWKPALKQAGVTYRPPIQIRHAFATLAIDSGEVFGWVQEMLGHSNIATTQVYTHITNRQLKEVHRSFHGKNKS